MVCFISWTLIGVPICVYLDQRLIMFSSGYMTLPTRAHIQELGGSQRDYRNSSTGVL